MLSCFALFISLGILIGQYDISKDQIKINNFKEFISQKENLNGRIVNIKSSEVSQQIILNIYDKENNKYYKIKLVTQKFPEYKVGDQVEAIGKIIFDEDLKVLFPDPNQTQKSFNLETKNKLGDVMAEMAFPKIRSTQSIDDDSESINKNQNIFDNFFVSLSNLKSSFIDILKDKLGAQTAALNAGVLLGDGSIFTKDELNNFRISGLSHIIVLSGFNISIIIVCLSILFSSMPLRWRVSFIIITLIFFILFVGPSISIIRSGIMGIILLIANVFGRQYVAKQALFISAFVMMIISPKIALYDVSFHLSFLATFGILYLMPMLQISSVFLSFSKAKNLKNGLPTEKESLFCSLKENIILKNILEIFKTTFAAQVAVLPYTMYTFGKVSTLGIIANVFVIPFVPIIMMFGFLIIIFYLLSYLIFFLSTYFFSILFFKFLLKIFITIFSCLDFIFSQYIFIIAKFIASLSHSQIESYISGYTLFILYFILISFLIFEEKRKRIMI